MKKLLLTYTLLLITYSLFAQTNCKDFEFDITDSLGNTVNVQIIARTILYNGRTKHVDTLKQFLSRDTAIGAYSLGIGCDKDTIYSQKLLIRRGDKNMVMIAVKRGFPSVTDENKPMPIITVGYRSGFTFYWDGDFDKNHNMFFRLVEGIRNK